MDHHTTTSKQKGSGGGSNWCWTDERHVRFLNSVEASFVRNMFQNSPPPNPRLDRQLPDCFESTQDLQGMERRRKRYSSSSDAAEYSSARIDKKNKRISSLDQVVPQLENRIEDDGIKDEKARDHALRSTTP
ncbi:hypothetical protein ACH5RR_017088 [Cinchona calisaya]|uniref:Uncharacterized protein n=1 Tax=Cinchona calisaya TaxID=153742 RepID=A0ABD2ZYZ1_9GENT